MAYLSILDSRKWTKHKLKRIDLYEKFESLIDKNKYYLPSRTPIPSRDVAFCFPIIVKDKNKELYHNLKSALSSWGIECRPFISGNMLRQNHYGQYGDYKKFKNAEYLNNFAMYVGLHPYLKDKQMEDLCKKLNSL
jgi:dTDP-4-amino-4,6-dideoxygalactose transaminase